MHMKRRCLCAMLALCAAAAMLPHKAMAQGYPNRPIRLIVPFAAGGAVDVLARLIAGKLSDQVGQPVIVENRPGAGGTLDRRRRRGGAVVPLATAVPLIQDGRIRGLAITGLQRSPTVPDIPTVAESGVPGFASNSWQGWFMAGKTPAPIVERIQQETAKALALPDVRSRLAAMAYDGIGQPPAEFTAYYKDEIAKFTKVVADAKIPKQ